MIVSSGEFADRESVELSYRTSFLCGRFTLGKEITFSSVVRGLASCHVVVSRL